MASPPNSYHDGNTDVPTRLLQPGSPASSDSDSGSFNFPKPSVDFLHHSLILEFNGGTESFTLPRSSQSFRRPKHGSEHITLGGTLSPNQHLFLPQADDSQHLPLEPALSESSFHSFDSTPDNLESRANLFMDDTDLLDRPPFTPFDSIFKPTVDKGLFEPQHPLALDGYVQAHSLSNLTTLPGSNSTQKLKIPNIGEHLPAHSPLTPTPTNQAHRNDPNSPSHPPIIASESGSDCFMTAPTSFESNSGGSFETAPTSFRSGSGYSKSAAKSNANILESQLHPTSNSHAKKRRRIAPKPPNWTHTGNMPPDLAHYQWTVFADNKNHSKPQRSASFYSPHPRAQNPPPRKDPFHDGSLLTPAIHAAVNEAIALFEANHWNRMSSLPGLSSNPFSLYTPEALACQYATTVDAKNALVLRQSAVVADIGLFLEMLIPKINTHATDKVKLINIHRDLDYIHEACSNRQINIQFSDLEWRRSAVHPCGLAFTDENRHKEFSWRERIIEIDDYHDAEAVGLQFLDDPTSLMDNRFPALRTQR